MPAAILCIDGIYYKRLDRRFEQWKLLPEEERRRRWREYMREYRARKRKQSQGKQ